MSDCLILNANYKPLSLMPLSVVSWSDAIKLQYRGRITVLEVYEDWEIHSPSVTMNVPALAVTSEYHGHNGNVKFSRKNLYIRDLYQCQYCGTIGEAEDLNIDHVVPRVAGGKTTWDNCVTSCITCNTKKGSKLLKPMRSPFKPDYHTLASRRSEFYDIKHPSWEPYLTIEKPRR